VGFFGIMGGGPRGTCEEGGPLGVHSVYFGGIYLG
jgi:hypothetical protein